jgi:hypothetical protein
MTPGRVDGQHFHGTMRNLSANHVALVDTPRVRSAVVGDSAPRIVPRILENTEERRYRRGSLWF